MSSIIDTLVGVGAALIAFGLICAFAAWFEDIPEGYEDGHGYHAGIEPTPEPDPEPFFESEDECDHEWRCPVAGFSECRHCGEVREW